MAGIFLRAGTAQDQETIRRIIREARLFPFGLEWPHFVVAEQEGQVVGVGQVKTLGDGTPELASLAVLPSHQGSGVGAAIVWTLVDLTPPPIYLRCASHNEGYYWGFGFRTLSPGETPRSLRREVRVGNAVVKLINWFSGGTERLLAMGRW
jgi:N-acetylglutamate synthase-like GNAT family acetyltransferase